MREKWFSYLLAGILITCLILLTLNLVDTYGKNDEEEVPKVEIIQEVYEPVEKIPERYVEAIEIIEETEEEAVEVIEEYIPPEEDVIALAQTMYGECLIVHNTMKRAAVAWCVLNRLDDGGYGDTVVEVVSNPGKFAGYSPSNPLDADLMELARDVMVRWHMEQEGVADVGRVLPASYKYFHGDGVDNYFREDYLSTSYWDWSLPDVYDEVW